MKEQVLIPSCQRRIRQRSYSWSAWALDRAVTVTGAVR
jgi:hypothetical protein